MSNYSKTSAGQGPRTELHDALSLTGAEITINNMPAGGSVPFAHKHKENEEIYGFLAGKGTFVIDGEDVPVEAGDWIRIAPDAKRQLFAAPDSPLSYICIQVKQNSLGGFTSTDGVPAE